MIESSFTKDIADIQNIASVSTILDVICETTGMGFAAVARVTESRWTACSICDKIALGLKPGGELQVETTICHAVQQKLMPVVIDNVAQDETYRRHPMFEMYGFQSYISMPIILQDGTFFGTLCAIDRRPALLSNPHTLGMFKLFAELIAVHLQAIEKVAKSESSLKQERDNAQLRDQFIAILGHDLRSPLGAISSGTHLLERMSLDERGKQVTRLIRDCVTRMTGLIETILDYARGRLGSEMPLNRIISTSIECILHQITEEMRVTYRNRAIESEYYLPIPVYCDQSRIGQVLSNLLGNALKYGSPDAPVIVRAKSNAKTFEVMVSNSGKPIPPAIMQSLFNPFTRGERLSDQHGLGLGLYIAAEIARAHHGVINVLSTENETRFTFIIPNDAELNSHNEAKSESRIKELS